MQSEEFICPDSDLPNQVDVPIQVTLSGRLARCEAKPRITGQLQVLDHVVSVSAILAKPWLEIPLTACFHTNSARA